MNIKIFCCCSFFLPGRANDLSAPLYLLGFDALYSGRNLQLFGTKLLSLSAAMKMKAVSSYEMFVSLVSAINLDNLTMN